MYAPRAILKCLSANSPGERVASSTQDDSKSILVEDANNGPRRVESKAVEEEGVRGGGELRGGRKP